jgi:hypothetical protein
VKENIKGLIHVLKQEVPERNYITEPDRHKGREQMLNPRAAGEMLEPFNHQLHEADHLQQQQPESRLREREVQEQGNPPPAEPVSRAQEFHLMQAEPGQPVPLAQADNLPAEVPKPILVEVR